MTLLSKLLLYFITPVLVFAVSFGSLSAVGSTQMVYHEALALVTIIALIITIITSLISRYYVLSEMQDGIAILKNRHARLPTELTIVNIFGNQIDYWVSFNQPLHTTVSVVVDQNIRAYFDIDIERTLTNDRHGKQIAANLQQVLPILEESVQRSIYQASEMDKSLGELFSPNRLLNEEDIDIIKSKLLSAIESEAVQGIFFSHQMDTISLDIFSVERVTRDGQKIKNSTINEEEEEDDDLSLDIDILDLIDKE